MNFTVVCLVGNLSLTGRASTLEMPSHGPRSLARSKRTCTVRYRKMSTSSAYHCHWTVRIRPVSINDQIYHSLYSTGSTFSTLYGLPKVHKANVPLRPILAAYNSPNYSIAKFLVPLLNDISCNQYSLRNSSKFIPEILEQNSNTFMTSFDVKSLFTNVTLAETIDIISNKLFPTINTFFHGFNRLNFKKLLELSVIDTHFTFNGKIYKQVDGMAMGSPLGPTFANIFMSFLERIF